ncbi:hypothetical protein G6F56_009735 [Rhizopus delemar]|nr:hypothetical protein G6F56_009735 [Rhizopus delemar]
MFNPSNDLDFELNEDYPSYEMGQFSPIELDMGDFENNNLGTKDSNNEAFSFNGLSENEEEESFDAGYPGITTFDSTEEAESYATGFARGKNFVIVRNRSKNKKTGLLQSIDLVCNRAKKSSPMKEGAVRKSKSKRIECKFFWKGSFVGGTWKITVKESVHSHRPSGSERLGHASSSVRLTDE